MTSTAHKRVLGFLHSVRRSYIRALHVYVACCNDIGRPSLACAQPTCKCWRLFMVLTYMMDTSSMCLLRQANSTCSAVGRKICLSLGTPSRRQRGHGVAPHVGQGCRLHMGLKATCTAAEPQAEGSAATEFGSLMGKVQGIVWDLSHAQTVVECAWDPTLHLGSLGKAKSGGGAGARRLRNSLLCLRHAQTTLLLRVQGVTAICSTSQQPSNMQLHVLVSKEVVWDVHSVLHSTSQRAMVLCVQSAT